MPSNSVPHSHVFVSYRTQEPDLSLARELTDGMTQAGHSAFMAAEKRVLGGRLGLSNRPGIEAGGFFLISCFTRISR